MPEFVRVKDRDTGHEYSIREDFVRNDAHEVLSKDAVDARGDVLPPKQLRNVDRLVDDNGEPITSKTKAELTDYAAARGIDLGEASLKDDILTAVLAHEGADQG